MQVCVSVCVAVYEKTVAQEEQVFVTHIYCLHVIPPFVRSETCCCSWGRDNGLNFAPRFLSHTSAHAHTHTHRHTWQPLKYTHHRVLFTNMKRLFFACSWSFGGNCPRLSVERQKSSQNSKCNYWERHRLVWGDTAIWREKRKAGAVAAPSKIATEADQSSPGATVGEAEHKMKNK